MPTPQELFLAGKKSRDSQGFSMIFRRELFARAKARHFAISEAPDLRPSRINSLGADSELAQSIGMRYVSPTASLTLTPRTPGEAPPPVCRTARGLRSSLNIAPWLAMFLVLPQN